MKKTEKQETKARLSVQKEQISGGQMESETKGNRSRFGQP
jgi:hypothetical protein